MLHCHPECFTVILSSSLMKETGKDLPSVYKETSEGGLAKHLD